MCAINAEKDNHYGKIRYTRTDANVWYLINNIIVNENELKVRTNVVLICISVLCRDKLHKKKRKVKLNTFIRSGS